MAKGVWAKGLDGKMNATCLFLKSVLCDSEKRIEMQVAGADSYKIFCNGKSVFFGPTRTAHGYAVVNTFSLDLQKGENIISILINSYNVATFSHIKQAPFLYLRINGLNEEITERDFACYDYTERIKNAQRYSYQRGFNEQYVLGKDFSLLCREYMGKQPLALSVVETPVLVNEDFSWDGLDKVEKAKKISDGTFEIDEALPLWKDRSVYQVGNCFEGYKKEELLECVSDTVSQFSYAEKQTGDILCEKEYSLYVLDRNATGFIRLRVSVKKKAEIYLTFEELLSEKGVVYPFRIACCNIVKWTLEKGEYLLETNEPYTLAFAQIHVKTGEIAVENIEVVLVENASAYRLQYEMKDRELQDILRAGQNTMAQNSTEFLTDCPSRERACWLNDLYYSRQSAEVYFGDQSVVYQSLKNIILDEGLKELPEGMVPMCYPSEHLNGEYIPNCAMWFALCVCDYHKRHGFGEFSARAKEKVYGIVKFFEKFENSDGLLEDLESWVFVEWSAANRLDFVSGVNYPTNMLYAKTLAEIGATFEDDALIEKAKKMKKVISTQSFDGEFFQDNRVRENGELVLKGHISEACQYFAFFSGVATVESHSALYYKLRDEFGVFRDTKKVYPHIDRANIITGQLMRLDILNENGEFERVVKEVKRIFGVMAQRTQTLWEMVDPSVSCNHCIASYSTRILLRAITGLQGYAKGEIYFSEDFCANYDGEILFPIEREYVRVKIEKGKRSIERISK